MKWITRSVGGGCVGVGDGMRHETLKLYGNNIVYLTDCEQEPGMRKKKTGAQGYVNGNWS